MSTNDGPMALPMHQYLGSPSDLAATVGMPMTSGPDANAMLAQFNLEGSGLNNTQVDKLFDQNKTPGSLMSNIYVVSKLGVKQEGWQAGDTYIESPLYAEDSTEAENVKHDILYGVKSQYTRNAYLSSEQGCLRFGECDTYQPLERMSRFVGFQVVGPAAWQRNSRTANFLTYIPAGRTRTKETIRAQVGGDKDRQSGAVANEQDYVFLLTLKCRKKNPLKAALQSSEMEIEKRLGRKLDKGEEDGDCTSSIPETYWNDAMIATVNKERPPLWKYMSHGDGLDPSSEWVGQCKHIAKIQSTEGTRITNELMTAHARRAQMGEGAWEHSLNALRNIELMTAIR